MKMDFLRILIVAIAFLPKTVRTSASPVSNEIPYGLICDFLTKTLSHCKFNIISQEDTHGSLSETFQDQILTNLIEQSAGITNILLQGANETELPKIHRPISLISSPCSVTVLLLLTEATIESMESVLTEILTKPLLNPFTVNNADKYVFIYKDSNTLTSLANSPLVTKMKYKLAISFSGKHGDTINFYSFCPHCTEGGITSVHLHDKNGFGNMDFYFQDFQKNFYGALHRIVASQKISSLMEIEKDEATGKYFGARGSHAEMLFHLMRKLNFTYEILPAAQGITGLQLPNGTWIGAVGDLIAGKADWAHLLAVDYNRNLFVESCSGVSYENWGFIVGPPRPVYTWKSIFWPFTFQMWICIVSASFVSIIFGHFFIHYGYDDSENTSTFHQGSKPINRGNYVDVTYFIAKSFIGQYEGLPVGLPQPIKIFYGFWLLFALVGMTAYTSNLVTFMTFGVIEQAPESFRQLAQSDYGITLQYFGSVIDSVLKNSKDPTFLKVVERMDTEPDRLTCIYKTVKSKHVCLIYEVIFNDLKYKNFSNRLGETPIRMPQTAYGFTFAVGVAHEKKAALSQNFKWIIHWAQEMGIVGQWKVMHFANLLKEKNAWERQTGISQELTFETKSGLQLSHLIGAFVIYVFGIISAIFIFLLEKSKHYVLNWKRRNDIQNFILIV